MKISNGFLIYTQLRWILFPAVLLFVGVAQAWSLIVYGSNDQLDPSDPDYNETYTLAPENGAPWNYVARLSQNAPSAVYLGHGFVLTANHVGTKNTGILINGQVYDRDQIFGRIHVTKGNDNADLSLWKIIGDPGLAELPITIPNEDSDLGLATTLIGWGAGKGDRLTSGWGSSLVEFWAWDESIQIKRWGTNVSDTSSTSLFGGVNFEVLRFFQNRGIGGEEAALAKDDSGCGLFQQFDGTWKLSGIGVYVYNQAYPAWSGFKSRNAYFFSEAVRLSAYSHLLRFDNWKAAIAGSSSLDALNDDDGDSFPLLMEYAMGMSPDEDSTAQAPVMEVSGTQVTITYRRLMSATDIRFVVEESSNLIDWEPASVVTRVNTDRVDTLWTWKEFVDLGEATVKYLRVRVTRL